MMKMETIHIAYALLFFCLHAIFCFPSKPLDERTSNLTWQAWLLVGDQNNSRYYDSEVLKTRRITPKSVFIAPTFTPESLPACREGYLPDSMGRCIKIVKINEEARLEFLLEKLNAQFGDDEEPFQINIPLNAVEESDTGNQDIAIVVAPTNGNSDTDGEVKAAMNKNDLHSQQKKSPEEERHNNNLDITTTTKEIEQLFELTTTTEPPTVKNYNNNVDIISATTKFEHLTEGPFDSTTVESSTEIFTSITEAVEATTQHKSPSSESENSTPNPLFYLKPNIATETTPNPLFFLKPLLTYTEHVQNGTNNTGGTPVAESSNNNQAISSDSLTTRLSNPTFIIDTSININNKNHLPVNIRQKQNAPSIQFPNSDDLMTSENVHQSGFVRFPTQDKTSSQLNVDSIAHLEKSTENLLSHTNVYADQFRYKTPHENHNLFNLNIPKRSPTNQMNFFENYSPSGGISLNDRLVFANQDEERRDGVNVNDYRTNLEHKFTKYPILNRRNRDKHSSLWSLPPFSINSSPHKPIILRFRGRSVNNRQILEERLRPKNSKAFYREFPREDFSYIFGVNQNRNRR